MTPATSSTSTCSVDGCVNAPARGGMCWSHVKRRQRRRPLGELRERGRGPKAVLMEAIFGLMETDASDRAAWERAWARVRMAARRYVLAPKTSNRSRPRSR